MAEVLQCDMCRAARKIASFKVQTLINDWNGTEASKFDLCESCVKDLVAYIKAGV